MRVVICFLLIQLSFTEVLGQSPISIQGKVNGKDEKAVLFANLLLKNAEDSAIVAAAVSDSTGSFLFRDVKTGVYYISVSAIGYKRYQSGRISANVSDNNVVIVPEISLQEHAHELGTVRMVAQRHFIEQHLDKMIVHVDKSIVSSGNAIIDILERSPGVIVDQQNEQIQLRNRTGVIVMIDGKQNFLSGNDLFQFLRGLNSEQVDRIEIITNPSSRYDAAGNAGIINIRLKKNTSFGTNGTASAAISRGFIPDATQDLWRGTLNVSLNHRAKNLNLFGNFGLNREGNYTGNTLARTFQFSQLNSFFRQQIDRGNRIKPGNFRAGADYPFSEATSFGLTFDYNAASTRSLS